MTYNKAMGYSPKDRPIQEVDSAIGKVTISHQVGYVSIYFDEPTINNVEYKRIRAFLHHVNGTWVYKDYTDHPAGTRKVWPNNSFNSAQLTTAGRKKVEALIASDIIPQLDLALQSLAIQLDKKAQLEKLQKEEEHLRQSITDVGLKILELKKELEIDKDIYRVETGNILARVLRNGSGRKLVITIDISLRHDLRQGLEDKLSYSYLESMALEDLIANSDFEFISPEEIGALTSSENTILAYGVYRSDDGKLDAIFENKTFWDRDYQIRSFVDELAKTGVTVFYSQGD